MIPRGFSLKFRKNGLLADKREIITVAMPLLARNGDRAPILLANYYESAIF